jgi:outer membrane receptor for ferrienterochelin and colicin
MGGMQELDRKSAHQHLRQENPFTGDHEYNRRRQVHDALRPASQHTLVTGGQWFNAMLNDQNPGRRMGHDETFELNQWALFAEDEWRITDSFSWSTGLSTIITRSMARITARAATASGV